MCKTMFLLDKMRNFERFILWNSLWKTRNSVVDKLFYVDNSPEKYKFYSSEPNLFFRTYLLYNILINKSIIFRQKTLF